MTRGCSASAGSPRSSATSRFPRDPRLRARRPHPRRARAGGDRNYQEVHYAIDGFPPIRELVELGDDGFLRWRDPGCVRSGSCFEHRRRDALTCRCRQASSASTATRAGSGVDPGPRIMREKPLARATRRRLRRPFSLSPSGSTSRPSGSPIFDPQAVFRARVAILVVRERRGHVGHEVRAARRTDGERPVLRLRRSSATSRSVVIALATRPTWTGADLAQLRRRSS